MDYDFNDDDDGQTKATRSGCCANLKTHMVLWTVLGAVFLTFGLIAHPVIDSIMAKTIDKDVALTSTNAQLFPIWSNTSKVPSYMCFWMWNLTNPEAVLSGAKPNMSLMGPYNYREVRLKDNISWSTDGARVHYTYSRVFTRVETICPPGELYPTEECSLPDNVTMTTANIPLMQLVGLVGDLVNGPNISDTMRQLIIDAVQGVIKSKNETSLMQRSVYEVIWGYEDELLKELNKVLIELLTALKAEKLIKELGLPLPELVQLQENNPLATRTNVSEIYTGQGDINKLFTFTQWTGYKGKIDTWKGTKCPNTTEGRKYIEWANMINGTEALSFRPNIKSGESLYVFSDDLHRSSLLVHTDNVKTKGVDTFRFRIDPAGLNNASQTPYMCAFDAFQPSGTLNIQAFTGGPVYASKHHFLDADPIYLSMIDGVSPPVRALHDTTLDIEPHTGSSFEVHQRLQINVQMRRVDGFPAYQDLQDGGFYLPVAKVDENGLVTDELIKQWKSQVGVALKARNMVHQGGIIGGSALLLLGLVFGVALYRTKRPPALLLINGDDESVPLLD
eukprot:m.172565 g.172565  ORF g.172565 m.172565 type:complete len:562 (+) comp16720_c0_seq2:2532-4217(+)